MPRAETQTSITNRWIRENADWLGADHEPLVQQLRMLAKTMDTALADKGMISSSHSSAYQKCFGSLLAEKSFDGTPGGRQPAAPAADPDDALFGPAS